MKLAVMQPYLFPYVGYFQLIDSVDLFLIYDDVAYIKRGFVNRNDILAPNGVTRFTISVPGASQNKLFTELEFSKDVDKALKTIEHSYIKAPYFKNIFPIVQDVLEFEERSIADICKKCFVDIFSYLGIEKQFKKTSELDYDRSLSARDRLIDLCHQFGADSYVNASGGRKLYDKNDFSKKGVNLEFLDSLQVEYSQGANGFIPNLSIIDILMNCSVEEVKYLLKNYKLD